VTDNATQQAYLLTDSYAGRSEQAVLVIGATPKRYRIKAVMRTRMPGRCRWLYTGEVALVPKTAVRFT
jgi:hypothetical protein